MQLKTILNRIQKQPGFVYGAIRLVQSGGRLQLEVELRPRANRQPRCSQCQRPRPGYDTLAPRRFEFVPVWGIAVFFLYAVRRVQCAPCGVRVEAIPWAEGKHQLTTTYAWFLAGWAKRLSWTAVAEVFHTTWDHVFRSVAMAVRWGLTHRDLTGITALGVDEFARRRGHRYVTLVYQLDPHCRRLLWIGRDRRARTLLGFFRWLGPQRTTALRFVCSDMWQPYLRVVAKKAGHALHVLDRFHIMSHMNKAIDQVRAQEARALKAQGRAPVLTRTRWLLLKRPDHLTAGEWARLIDLVRHNLKAVRSYLLREEFQFFWTYKSATWAGRFLDRWCTKALRSRIEPMQKVARMLRTHRPLLLNYFRAKRALSAAAVEGFNNKARVTTRIAYGFRTYRVLEMALHHTLGALPEPETPHRFC
ncbi:MAG: ISL3 family transposase [Candidatus Rokuibacteriota bacterium]|nr:MAG: ISL3 family transposase [Candidatus Rokubacteria bacterium]